MTSSDSDDDMPLAARVTTVAKPQQPASNGAAAHAAAAATNGNGAAARPPQQQQQKPPQQKQQQHQQQQRPAAAAAAKPKPKRPRSESEDDDDDASSSGGSDDDDDSDSEDDVPLAARATPQRKAAPAAKKARKQSPAPKAKKPAAAAAATTRKKAAAPRARRSPAARGGGKAAKGEPKWTTLEHCGVLFPPEYEPHGVKLLYEGRPVDLTQDQEEVATMFAAMRGSDYMEKPAFLRNFWEGFRAVLGPRHVVQDLGKCDFTPIADHLEAEREKKKQQTKEEKAALKAARDAAEAKYKVALVDGRQEQVGNFRVEPPGLFRGRGEHPKMGKVKSRVYPRDITINIGRGAPVPTHPYPGQQWKEVRHDNTVTWLAFWKDTVNPKEYKYVWLGANSSFKAESDLLKYEKARKLKDYIAGIRRNYTRDWDSTDLRKKQMAVAVYFLDKLALRAGHEKDDDEADTVGCCTLKVENVECVAPSQIRFDFLGKDSIRYENTVDVEPKVYKAVQQFKQCDSHGKRKQPRDMLFDTFVAQDLNAELKQLMEGLSVKVFRTYNASVTLDKLLADIEADVGAAEYLARGVDAKKADYDRANKEVAILCNHQRSVPKTHEASMLRMQEKLDAKRQEIRELEAERTKAARDKSDKAATLKARIEKKLEQLQKAELQAAVKDDLKTVALGTSKINYMDPRITIAWCKRNEVPVEKVFNKSLISKFHWAMDVTKDFRF